jgi:site-specific DNA recombinase
MTNKPIRCAIYTRKSSEEGLDQSFNSLEAQREACRAFILSQKHEGWIALTTHYDDGGFSAATMERPALKQLLSDILAGKIETVVVYKVDRLTRSLSDFSKIIEVFDSHGVSFVSVTQQFNTTTSMGRLTLNVLLSFAQFEREITGERIRDKVAASKKKGMWMGGVAPQGYDCVDRRLVVNHKEARTVRRIFRAYLRLGCATQLKEYLDRKEIRSKARISSVGRASGGTPYSRGALYHLLNNRIYIGEIVHQGKSHPGLHEAIIPRDLWDKVEARLEENNQAHRVGASHSTKSLLTGKLFDSNGARFTPTHAVKNAKRYRYYTSQTVIRKAGLRPEIARFPAQELEQFVTSKIGVLLQTPARCVVGMKNGPTKGTASEKAQDLATRWPELESSQQHEFVRNVLRRVTVGQTAVWIELDRIRLIAALLGQRPEALRPLCARGSEILRLTGEFQVQQRGRQTWTIPPHGSPSARVERVPSLVKAIARARDWYERIVAGEIDSIEDLIQKSGLTRTYIMRIMRCAHLSPKIVEAVLAGTHRPDLSLKWMLADVPLDWREQEKRILQGL